MTPRRRGPWVRHRWLLARRSTQAAVLLAFLLGPLADVWIIRGTAISSLVLDIIPLTDPFVLLQSLAAGQRPTAGVLIGAGLVAVAYGLLGGRAYCAWICPINLVTDGAWTLRRRLGLGKGGLHLRRGMRYWILGTVLTVAATTGTLAWELINPVTMAQRAIVFGGGVAWGTAAAVFVFDLLVAERGWCGHLCPQGAFYALLGSVRLIRLQAIGRARCDRCMACYAACPEPQALAAILQGTAAVPETLVRTAPCTQCGRCADVCPNDVFAFGKGIMP